MYLDRTVNLIKMLEIHFIIKTILLVPENPRGICSKIPEIGKDLNLARKTVRRKLRNFV